MKSNGRCYRKGKGDLSTQSSREPLNELGNDLSRCFRFALEQEMRSVKRYNLGPRFDLPDDFRTVSIHQTVLLRLDIQNWHGNLLQFRTNITCEHITKASLEYLRFYRRDCILDCTYQQRGRIFPCKPKSGCKLWEPSTHENRRKQPTENTMQTLNRACGEPCTEYDGFEIWRLVPA